MTHQISHIAVHQTSKILALVYGVIGILLFPLLWLSSFADPENAIPFWLALFVPLLYALFGYIFTALMLVVYNALAKGMGGIELTLTPIDATPADTYQP